MSKFSKLELTIKDLRTAAAIINDVANTLAEMFSGDPHTGGVDEPAAPSEPQLTLEQVRAVLADKSREGYTADIRTLLQKYGASKLSGIDPANYEALLAEVEVLGNGYIEKFIERLGERSNIREIAFDRWGAVQMVQNLEGMGFTVVPFGQGFKDMSPPTKELIKLVLEEKIAHGGHPVLRWMMDNIFIRTDPAGNIKPDKEKSTEKIDGAVATIMALDRAIRCGNDTGASVYDDRGILFI